MARRTLRLSAFAIAGLAGCAATPITPTLSISPTEVAVAPEAFLGTVQCSPNPGAMQSFVVTLFAFDSESDTTPFTLPSTVPTPCSTEAGIQSAIVPGQLYIAEVDGYELPQSSLTPFGGASSGSREMVDSKGKIVAPRWTTRCGLSAASAVVAFSDQTNYLPDCEPLVDHATSPTQVRIDPASILAPGGGDPCLVAATIQIDVLSGALPPIAPLACSAQPRLVPATAGTSYRLYAHTTSPKLVPLGSECGAVAAPGVTVTATCPPLSSVGAAVIDLGGLVKGGKPACPAGSFYDVIGSSGVLNHQLVPCDQAAQIGPLAPGIATFSIAVRDGKGNPAPGGAACAADVLAGRTVAAVCL